MPTQKNSKRRRAVRQLEAAQRQQAYDQLTPEQRLSILDYRFGFGRGARKERARLNALAGVFTP